MRLVKDAIAVSLVSSTVSLRAFTDTSISKAGKGRKDDGEGGGGRTDPKINMLEGR